MSKDKRNIKLSDIPKKDPFGAPDGYFKTLSDSIIRSAGEGKVTAEERRSISFRWNLIGYAAAASIILILMLARVNNQEDKAAEEFLAEVSSEDLIAYLNSTEIENYEIVQSTDPKLWESLWEEVELMDTELVEGEIDLLYERYNNTSD